MVRVGQFEGAAKLLGAASILKPDEEPDSSENSRNMINLKEDLNAIRAALGEEAFAAAWGAGRALPLEVAVQVALSSGLPDPGVSQRRSE
jgi:hypothetical protein